MSAAGLRAVQEATGAVLPKFARRAALRGGGWVVRSMGCGGCGAQVRRTESKGVGGGACAHLCMAFGVGHLHGCHEAVSTAARKAIARRTGGKQHCTALHVAARRGQM